MFDDTPELAVQGEAGIDIFLRLDDPGQKRARFRCVATLAGTRLIDHAPEDRRNPARLRTLAEGLAQDALAQPLSLADPSGWAASLAGGDPIAVFLRLDFLRAWSVAELAAARLERQLTADPTSLPQEPGKVAGAVAPLFDFNRLGRGQALARLALPVIGARISAPGFADDGSGSTGYALRMLGDLCLRAADAAQALACFEAAIATGDNPFRRRRAIEAALALGDTQAAGRHRAAYAARWPLPDDLKGPP